MFPGILPFMEFFSLPMIDMLIFPLKREDARRFSSPGNNYEKVI